MVDVYFKGEIWQCEYQCNEVKNRHTILKVRQENYMSKKKQSLKHEHQQESPVPKGRLLAIGGHEDKGVKELKEEQRRNRDFESQEILKFLVSELQGEDPAIIVVPTASTLPGEAARDYVNVFKELEVKKVEVMDIRNRSDACKPEFLEMVERAAGIMFTGGDQLRLTAILGARRCCNS